MKRGVVLFLLVMLVSFSSVSAEHQVSPTSLSGNLGEISQYTVTITNTDTYADDGTNTNITSIDITLPSGINFVSDTNSTSSFSTFSNTSTVLTWQNTSYVIGSLTGTDNSKTFIFSVNATSLGSFNISVRTTNSTGNSDRGITLTVSDNEDPKVFLVDPEDDKEDNDGVLIFECNATDNINLDSIALYIWDSNKSEVYKDIIDANGTSKSVEWDYSFDKDDEYRWNCFSNDTSGNFAWATNRTLTIALTSTSCTENWTCANWTTCSEGNQTRTCTDSSSCGATLQKPQESQTCIETCEVKWECGEWSPSECPKNATQTRECSDKNACDDDTEKPAEKRVCTIESSLSSSGTAVWIFASIVGILVIGGSAAAAIFYFKKKSGDELYPNVTDVGEQSGDNNNGQGYTYDYS